jgi:hypothetical protein
LIATAYLPARRTMPQNRQEKTTARHRERLAAKLSAGDSLWTASARSFTQQASRAPCPQRGPVASASGLFCCIHNKNCIFLLVV